jgi:hypothetical protein
MFDVSATLRREFLRILRFFAAKNGAEVEGIFCEYLRFFADKKGGLNIQYSTRNIQ